MSRVCPKAILDLYKQITNSCGTLRELKNQNVKYLETLRLFHEKIQPWTDPCFKHKFE